MAPPLSESLRNQILGMLKAKCSVNKIRTTLGCHKSTIFRIKKRAKERNEDLSTKKGSGRKISVVNKRLVDIVRKKINRDPTKSGRALARESGLCLRSMQKAILAAGFKSMSLLVMHDIMPGQKERRLERAIKLLEWRADANNFNKIIIWTDEKLFLVQQHLNKRNNRIFLPLVAADHTLRIVRKRKNPSKVMVFAAVASDGEVMDPIFFPANTTVNSLNYQQVVLTKLVLWIRETWPPGTTILMQNGAPAHTSASTQSWLTDNLGPESFWKKTVWPPSSPDCNPLDFSIWTRLVTAVCKTEPRNREDLIRRIKGMWASLLDAPYVVKTCAAAWDRLRAVVEAKGDYSEGLKKNNNVEDVAEAVQDRLDNSEVVEATADAVEVVENTKDSVEVVENAEDEVEVVENAEDEVEVMENTEDVQAIQDAVEDVVEIMEDAEDVQDEMERQ